MVDRIVVMENALDSGICALLSQFFDMNADLAAQKDYNNNPVLHYYNLKDPDAIAILGDAAKYAKELIEQRLGIAGQFVESAFLARLGPGNMHEPHIDNAKLDGTQNHTPQRSRSSLFYLNGDFEGGEIVFPIQKEKVKPKRGMFIVFPSSPPYLHYVEAVISGYRYSLPVWFTKDKKKEMRFHGQDGQSEGLPARLGLRPVRSEDIGRPA